MNDRLLALALVLVVAAAGCTALDPGASSTTETTDSPNAGVVTVRAADPVPDNASVVAYEGSQFEQSPILRRAFEEAAADDDSFAAVNVNGTERLRFDRKLEDVPLYSGLEGHGYYVEHQSTVYRVLIMIED